MMKKIVIAIVLLFSFSSLDYAQYRTYSDREVPRMGIGPQIGYFKSGDADKGNLLYGLALRVRLTPALGFEGSVDYRQEEYQNGAITARTWPILLTGHVFLLPMIHGSAGVGWYNTTFDYGESDLWEGDLGEVSKQRFGWHLGGGAEIPLGTSTSLKGELKYHFLDYEIDELENTQIGDISYNYWSITVGILFGL